jgi:hypothetical protein
MIIRIRNIYFPLNKTVFTIHVHPLAKRQDSPEVNISPDSGVVGR